MGNTPRINVDNHAAWGKLVKSWATGRDYVTHVATAANPVPAEPAVGTAPAHPKPGSFKELVTQCLAHNVGMHFVATATTPKTFCTGNENIGFVLLQGTPEISILRLPSKDKIHESELAMSGANGANADYPIPQFYHEAFGTVANPAPLRSMTVVEKAEFHAKRVGEYTINTCW